MRHIRKAFPGVVALDEVHVLSVENGAGKSTLVEILSGAHALTSVGLPIVIPLCPAADVSQ
jgi:ABC-type sugar transport system ATPase subunit